MTDSQIISADRSDTDNNHNVKVVDYDAHSIEGYVAKWDSPMGLGEMALNDTRKVTDDGVFSLAAVPFQTAMDTVLDHPKYYAVSHDAFPMPESGSLQFSVDIQATTPGTEARRVIHGFYTDTPDGGRPYAQPTLEPQQAALMSNMTNVETGQLFDWFVAGSSAFALIERLPSIVTNPALPPTDPDYVGLDRIYTQIVKTVPLTPGQTHNFAIRYTRNAAESTVEYFLDGEIIATVDNVGIPLDTQGADYTGIYPSYHQAAGQDLKGRMNTFLIGHGLYSVLDAFPFQHPDAPELAVSIPIAERLFGQGAQGEFSKFSVTTVIN